MTSQAAIFYRITSASTVVSRACFCKQQRWVLDSEQEGGSLIIPMALAHPLHPINDRSRNKRRNLWVGCGVSSWWPMFSSRSSVSLFIYLYVCILYTGSGYRMYIYIHRECHSVLVELHPITSIRLFFGSVRFLCWMPLVVFFGFNHLCLTLW